MKKITVYFYFVLVGLFLTSQLHSQEADLLGKAAIGDLETVKSLIESGVNIDAQGDTYGYTALLSACEHNYIEMARYLLSKGADPNIRAKDGSTAIIRAASKAPEIVKILLSAGADINARANNGSGIITECVFGVLFYGRSMDLAEFLVSRVTDINEALISSDTVDGYTTLFWAARENHEPLASLLIEHGADVNAVAANGMTPLAIAEKEGNSGMVKLLKSLGAR